MTPEDAASPDMPWVQGHFGPFPAVHQTAAGDGTVR